MYHWDYLNLFFTVKLFFKWFLLPFNFLVYVDVKKNTAKGDEVVLLKKYIAWHFDQHAKKDPETMCVVLLDMSSASVSNVVSSCFFVEIPKDNEKAG